MIVSIACDSLRASAQLIGFFDSEGPLELGLEAATAIFSLVLFAVTLYAWATRGRQATLLIVSIAFLAFFSKQATGLLPISALHAEVFRSAMDLITLALFFLALVVRPRRGRLVEPVK